MHQKRERISIERKYPIMQLFGTAGIRGVTNKDITPQLAVEIGLAYGSSFSGKIAVARDNRYGAKMIEDALVSGLLGAGAEVHLLGIIPLPIFARYVADFMDGGIIVTGSHTPPNIIGIVAVDELGRDMYWDKSKKIEEIYERKDYKLVPWDRIKEPIYDDALENYMKFVEREARGLDGYKILIDPANGAGAGIINRIFEDLGFAVRCINCDRRPVPNRPSEPRRENLAELAKLSKNFDLAIGTDVDADRVLFASSGNVHSEDSIGALLASHYARKKIVTPINSSKLIEKVANERGFEVIYCPVGPPEIAEHILQYNADFGYEETGKYMFPPSTLWGDSVLTTLKILRIMNSTGSTLDSLLQQFPRYYQIKEKFPVEREVKRKVVERIGDFLEKNAPMGVEKILRIDGVKLIYGDSWLLIRASGTEDVIRVFSDAPSEERARELVNFGLRLVRDFLFSQQG